MRHIFYPSIQRRHGVAVQIDGVTVSDIETEQFLRDSGLTYTILALNAGISYSFDDVAAAYATALGVPVSYTDISRDGYIAERVAAGLPPPVAEFFSGWLAAIAAGAFDNPDSTLEKLIGQPAKPLVTLLATR